MAVSEASIVLMIKSHKRAPPRERAAFVELKRAIYDKFVQLREFGGFDLEHGQTKNIKNVTPAV